MRKWVVSKKGHGIAPNGRKRSFDKTQIGCIESIENDTATVLFIGTNQLWQIPVADLSEIDVTKTGDGFDRKICNVCHKLLPVKEFAKNQTGKGDRVIRRPSCHQCRTDIDKRAPKSRQAKEIEKQRPKKGDLFQCPICNRQSIVGVTAKIVADHNHHTGNIRDFICDSCNTGLGRFKNGNDYLQNAIDYLKERDSRSRSSSG